MGYAHTCVQATCAVRPSQKEARIDGEVVDASVAMWFERADCGLDAGTLAFEHSRVTPERAMGGSEFVGGASLSSTASDAETAHRGQGL